MSKFHQKQANSKNVYIVQLTWSFIQIATSKIPFLPKNPQK